MTDARKCADEMTANVNSTLQALLDDHLEDLDLIPAMMLADAATAVADHRFCEAIAVTEAYQNAFCRDEPKGLPAPVFFSTQTTKPTERTQ